LIAFVDSNILVTHITQFPPHLGERATRILRSSRTLLMPDVIVAETVFVLERTLKLDRPRVSSIMRSFLAMKNVTVVDPGVILRALALYEGRGLHFAEAYLVATAESTGVTNIASFDRDIDRVSTVTRREDL